MYDCNPRLTAIFPPLAVKRYLENQGISITSIINIDYRGRFVYEDITKQLAIFQQEDLLFTKKQPKGILVLPNLARDNGFDLLFINQTIEKVNIILKSGILGKGDDVDKGVLEQLYY